MGIKFAILRSHDGHAMDLLRPGATIKAGVGGIIEVLAQGTGKYRVGVNGVEIAGHPPQWPANLATPEADVVIEYIEDDVVKETNETKVTITGQPDAKPATPAPAVTPAAPILPQQPPAEADTGAHA